MEQLKELELEITSSSSMKLVEDEYHAIRLITIKHTKSRKYKQRTIINRPSIPTLQEKFSQTFGAVIFEEGGHTAKHVGRDREYVHILGEQLYSEGRKTVRFKIEYEQRSYNIFLGCISSLAKNDEIAYGSPLSAGWFGGNQIFHHGNIDDNGYDSSNIMTSNILILTFDCEKQQIELYHEYTNQTSILPIDTSKAPFPWRLLVVLCRPNNRVTILPSVQKFD